MTEPPQVRVYNHTRDPIYVRRPSDAGAPIYETLMPNSDHGFAGQRVQLCFDIEATQRALWTIEGEVVHVRERGRGGGHTTGAGDRVGSETENAEAPEGRGATSSAPPRELICLGFTEGTEQGTYKLGVSHIGRTGRPHATVIGAGIAGLTAAHELAERGFAVQVVDKAHRSPQDLPARKYDPGQRPVTDFARGLDEPDVGGIARTQWSTAPHDMPAGNQNQHAWIRRTRSVHGDGWLFPPTTVGPLPGADLGQTDVDPAVKKGAFGFAIRFGVGRGTVSLSSGQIQQILTWISASSPVTGLQLVLVVYRPEPSSLASITGLKNAAARLQAFLRELKQLAEDSPLRIILRNVEALPVARLDSTGIVDSSTASSGFAGLIIRQHQNIQLVAGEHGFRFFPGFYRNLRDTMGRTPIFDRGRERFTWRTVEKNLRRVEWQVIDDPARPHATALPRGKLESLGELMTHYEAIRKDLGYRPSDMLRFALRILRYATSSKSRRRRYYQDMSWLDFLQRRRFDIDDGSDPKLPYGARFTRILEHMPTALVSTDARLGDARTLGNVSVQLFIDQLGLHDHGDETLEGPTSEVWLNHWRDYLKQLGVRFYVGEATSITVTDTSDPREARVTIGFDWPTEDGKPPRGFCTPPEDGHYYVCALDLVGAHRLAKQIVRAPATPDSPDHGVLSDLCKLVGTRNLEDISKIGTGECDWLQTFTGVQLYFNERVAFENGHIYYVSSPYGLSAVSQIQYWSAAGTSLRGPLLGNLSVDIGIWRGSDRARAPHPNTLSPEALAGQVWHQITQRDHETRHRPGPDYCHIDDFIQYEWKPSGPRPKWNRVPYLVNTAGGDALRPIGKPWSAGARRNRDRVPGKGTYVTRVRSADKKKYLWMHRDGGYPVHYNGLVFAGTYLRTFTRLTTMESANESARHAVNAILDHATAVAPRQKNGDSAEMEERSASLSVAARKMPGSKAGALDQNLGHAAQASRNPTRYGDYCQTWDLEQYEIPDLELLRDIDRELVRQHRKREAREDDDVVDTTSPQDLQPPHLFDLLRLDELPDHLDTDHDVRHLVDLLHAGFAQLRAIKGRDATHAIAQLDTLRTRITDFVKELVNRRR